MKQKLPDKNDNDNSRLRIGAVSFFNARPLIYSLENNPDVHLYRTPPARLARALDDSTVDVALVPSIDYQTTSNDWTVLPVAAIGSDGPVLTVQVFSCCRPDKIDILACDTDSHTSIILAQIIWRICYDRVIEVVPMTENIDTPPAVLLIGDKVLSQIDRWPYQLDLGRAWTEQTQLPFVCAFWALRDTAHAESLFQILRHAYQQGMAHLDEIIERHASRHGFESGLAREYFTKNICYELDTPQLLGLRKFYELAYEQQLVSRNRPLCLYSPASIGPALSVTTKAKSAKIAQP